MSLKGLCRSSVDILRNAATTNATRTGGESWSAAYTGVACRIVPKTSEERAQWMGLPMMSSHTVYIPSALSYTILPTDRVLYGTRYFRIVGIRNPDELSVYWILDVEEDK